MVSALLLLISLPFQSGNIVYTMWSTSIVLITVLLLMRIKTAVLTVPILPSFFFVDYYDLVNE